MKSININQQFLTKDIIADKKGKRIMLLALVIIVFIITVIIITEQKYKK